MTQVTVKQDVCVFFPKFNLFLTMNTTQCKQYTLQIYDYIYLPYC